MNVTVEAVRHVLDAAYPPGAAESWDTGIGLTCGDPAAPVRTVLVAVDVTRAVVAQARELGADLLLTHHPLLFRPVQSVAADTEKGALVHALIAGGVAHLAAHTNADKAVGGVSEALADALGLTGVRVLDPGPDGRTGLGRVGGLTAAVSLAAFAERVAARLPATASGVRYAGPPELAVRTVAVCGGAGGSLLGVAAEAGADVVVTSDLSHHVVAEFRDRADGCAVVEVAHWAGEWTWLPVVAELLRRNLPGLRVEVSDLCTDPWTGRSDAPTRPPG